MPGSTCHWNTRAFAWWTGQAIFYREQRIASEPEALIAWFRGLGFVPSGSVWRLARCRTAYAAMRAAGLAVELLETRHVRDAFKAMPVKSDRNDARGIAQLMRLGWFRPVHCKSMAAQEMRALLTARKLVQSKLLDVQMSLRGLLRGFGLKVGATTPSRFAGRISSLSRATQPWRSLRRRPRSTRPCGASSLASRSECVQSHVRTDGYGC